MYKSHKQISKIQKLSNCLLDTIPIHANSVCFWFDKSCDVIPSTYNVGGDNNKDYYIVLVTDNKKLNRTYDSNGFYYLYYKDNYIRCHYKSYYSNDPSELIGKYIELATFQEERKELYEQEIEELKNKLKENNIEL
jgi:hypothetical protein